MRFFLLGNKDKKIETTNEKSEPKQVTTRPLPEPETESKKLLEVEEDEVEEIESQSPLISETRSRSGLTRKFAI